MKAITIEAINQTAIDYEIVAKFIRVYTQFAQV